MEFYFPTELGEQLAFGAAAVSVLIGLVMMFAPGVSFRFLGLQPREGRAGAYAEARSTGGLYVGLGLSAVLLAQPMVYLAIGGTFVMAAFGRILSIMSDRGSLVSSYILLVVQAILALLPLGYVFGFV